MRRVLKAVPAAQSAAPFAFELVTAPSVASVEGDQVLIRLGAAGLSALDVLVQGGRYGSTAPTVLGFEVAGVVEAAGSDVKNVRVGDRVAGLLPCDADGGLAEHFVAPSYFFVNIPANVTDADAVACLVAGARSYVALQYHMHALAGETVLLLDPLSETAYTAAQLLAHWKLTTLIPVKSTSERDLLVARPFKAGTLVDVGKVDLVKGVLNATGGMGVDAVLDLGSNSSNSNSNSNHAIVSCLGMGGRWLSSSDHLQVDPPLANQLWQRGASLCSVNEQAWVVSAARIGQFLHYLADVLALIDAKHLRPPPVQAFSFEKANDALALLLAASHQTRFAHKIVLHP